jgi:hypothetical protein
MVGTSLSAGRDLQLWRLLPFRQKWANQLCETRVLFFRRNDLCVQTIIILLTLSDFCAYTKQQNRWNYTICWNTNAIPEKNFGQVIHTMVVRQKKKSVCEDYEALEKPATEEILSEKYSPNFHSSQVRCEK